ncbi:MAG: hypothetical protein ACHQF4_07340, partial [Sphingobacteriales bacterium]
SERWLLLQHLLRVEGGQFVPESPGQFAPELVVSLRRNQVVWFIRISILGFVLFADINSVSGSNTLFTSWHPAAGTGIRVKFNKSSKTNIGIDYGFSKGYNAVILNLGEAF